MTSSPLARLASERPAYVALALALVCGLALQLAHHRTRAVDAWGWDESMHAELPAARMVVGLAEERPDEAFRALSSCDRYPFVFPAILAAGQAALGVSEGVARGVAWAFWVVVGLLGLVRVGLALARATARPDEPPPFELVLLLPLAAFLSPLVWRYAPTLFLEVPFLVVATHVLASWIARGADGARGGRVRVGRELLLGVGLALAFFTKFNYALLLFAGLGLDALAGLVLARRRGRGGTELRRLAVRALPLALALLWWFGWPLPASRAEGARHLASFLDFLGGNRGGNDYPRPRRLLDWYTGVGGHPAVLFTWVLAALASLPLVVVPGVRAVWLVLASTVLPVWFHPFHLDRFLIPSLLPLWALASLGLQRILAARHAWQARLGLALFAGLWAVVGAIAWRYPNHVFAGRLGLLPEDDAARARLVRIVDEDLSLFGRVPTAGLDRASHDALLDLVAAEVAPDERVAWFGMSSELSPAALHLGLLARGGSPARFLADAHRQMDVTRTPGARPPDFADEAARRAWLEAATAGFDVVLTTVPTDLKDRPLRAGFYEAFVAPLAVELGFVPRELGRVAVPLPSGDALEVSVFALRRP